MVGHDHVPKNVMPLALKVIKPLIHLIIGISNFEQPQPTATGNRNEINAAVLCYLPANRHIRKLAFCVPRISFHSRKVPETGNSAGKEVVFQVVLVLGRGFAWAANGLLRGRCSLRPAGLTAFASPHPDRVVFSQTSSMKNSPVHLQAIGYSRRVPETGNSAGKEIQGRATYSKEVSSKRKSNHMRHTFANVLCLGTD